ncbi:nitric oxide dioxygenase [Sinobacterium caligoides]|uniref:Flavohemoprotein n=1 Tax=Sinobacterium caligoides TaxID=933926 RepID=A0A3N2DPU0_9GAMM|nr:NO-inducible flavohemoprotein [Sinobacterium caligoides]ROS01807.1 nitric oxide dioxygenase [Sinobacterium caligoides]
MSLNQQTIEIIKSTVPAVAAHAEEITAHFYPLMFESFPQVKAYFNQSHQQSGAQSKALAGAVVAYAANIENLQVLSSAVDRIVNKHVSLDIRPEQYEIVGSCLLQAIKAVLGEAATDEVIAAWGEAYWQLANLLIDAEEEAYKAGEEKPGGWRGERSFKVEKKVKESDVITSFYLRPVDAGGVPEFKAGQYLGLVLTIDGETMRRNYSLSDAPNKDYLRISVKREQGGLVSNYLHDDVQIGDELSLLPPAGEFVVKESDRPLVLVTAGVGVTPAISMLNHCVKTGRKIQFIHAAISSKVHAFRQHVDALAKQFSNVSKCYVYSEPTKTCEPDATGFVGLPLLREKLAGNSEVDFYFLGPKPFMVLMNQYAHDLGIAEENIHFEFFGPLEDLQLANVDEKAA